jgi:hypothetical protein
MAETESIIPLARLPAVTDWTPVDLLPGLWVGFLGALLVSALRRWYDPVPWRAVAVFTAALLALFAPVLFGGRILLPLDNLRGNVPFQDLPPARPHGNPIQGDLIQLVAPLQAAVREALEQGRWPLWNQRAGAGMPLLADPQAQALQPLALLGHPLPLARAAGAVAALRVLAALIFAFLWLRRQGLSGGPALAGSLAYGLGGFVVLWVGWPLANPAALLPLALYAVARCDEPGGRRDAFLLALAALGLLLGGHPETIVYALGLTVLVLLDRVRRRPAGLRRALLVRAGGALLVAAAVAAPVLLPTLDYLPKTLRADRLRSPIFQGREAAGPSEHLALRWLPVAAPNAYGNSRFAGYWGLLNTNEDASSFVGTTTLLAALLALGARRRFPQEALALIVAALCLALLAQPPGLDRLLALLPAGRALATRRLMLPLSLCLAYLGACTLERFRRGEVRRWPLLAVAAGLAALIAWGYLAHSDPQDPERLAILRFGWLRWQERFLALATLLLLAAASWRRLRRPAVALVALIVGSELLLAHGPANPPMPRSLAFPQPESVGALKYGLGIRARRGFRMAALGDVFPPNLPNLYSLVDARVYNPAAPRAYVELIKPITVGWRGEVPVLGVPGAPLYRQLGVRLLLTPLDARLPAPWQRLLADKTAAVWEQPDPLPRVFIAARRPAGRVATPKIEDAWISGTSHLSRRQWLGTTTYQDGGWLLLVDGRRRATTLNSKIFVAARIPPGTRKLDLLYRPAAFVWGWVIAALGVLTGVMLWTRKPTAPGSRPRPEGPG